ncbi:MAG: prepilin-type N-terminal cleavage/methylation domain-containing protein [Planctomycetota bacterium]|nr:prepilin-type N-terminal cleavage/methylation domain-containing protein [Planctomycetota bacterium]
MTRRGMTMVELLLALALLSALMVAGVSWTTMSTRTLAEYGTSSTWSVAAEQALGWIDEALVTEDSSTTRSRRERWRISTEDGSLTLRTRHIHTPFVGEGAQHPVLCPLVNIVVRDDRLHATFFDVESRVVAERLLLGGLRSMDIVTTELEQRSVLVTVRLVSVRGASVARSWQLRREEIR